MASAPRRLLACLAGLAMLPIIGAAQSDRAVLRGSMHPLARREFDRGRLPADTPIGLVTLFFQKTPQQQSDLDSLLAKLQMPSDAAYHRWLTPQQYAERFGVRPADARMATEWLRSQGLAVNRVARAGTWVSFSGTAGQMERALKTELHRYEVDGEMRYAPAREPSVPAALGRVAAGVVGLDDFPMKPLHPPFIDLATGGHGVAPGDFAVIYDAAPLYAMGIDGSGQAIAIIGASDFSFSDIAAYRAYFGLPPNAPQVMVYGPAPAADPSWEFEETIDVDLSGAAAPNAKIIVAESNTPITALQYAVDDNLAPVMSFSAGDCEQKFTDNLPLLTRAIVQQANAQGETFVAASGDSGAAACEGHTDAPVATKGAAVAFPASLPEATSAGGTEFAEGGSTYWSSANGSDHSSALSYIPEAVWNTSALAGSPHGSGGGASLLYAKPAWQAGPGVPDDHARDVPDVSFPASGAHDPYQVFYGGALIFIGGTSAAAPAFAGVLALLNQYLAMRGIASAPGLGNINPGLYRLAQTLPGAFHDITSGDNIVPCVIGTPDCATGSFGFAAGPGYDRATGLGSIDVFNFVTGWSSAGSGSAVRLSADAASVPLSGSLKLTAVVVPADGGPTPSGTATFLVGTSVLGAAALDNSSGAATSEINISAGQLAVGADTITAVYGGDSHLNGSAASVTVTVTVPTTNSAVVPSVIPNPVYQSPPDSQGNTFVVTVTLQEMAGIATTLTGFTIDGAAQPLTGVFPATAIAAKGTISGTVRMPPRPVPATVTFGVSGRDASGFEWRQQVNAQFAGPVYFTQVVGVGNAASGQLAAAPGMALSVYGTGLASSATIAAGLPLPETLENVSATVNGAVAPLYFASPTQINLQVPYGTAPGTAVLAINNNGLVFTSAFPVQAASPGIFVDVNGNTVPFAAGSRGQTLTLFITGEGALSPALATGATPPLGTPPSQLPAPVQLVAVGIGNVPAQVTFVGVPSGLAGVTQINFVVPQNAPLGAQPIVVAVGNVLSPAAKFTVQQ